MYVVFLGPSLIQGYKDLSFAVFQILCPIYQTCQAIIPFIGFIANQRLAIIGIMEKILEKSRLLVGQWIRDLRTTKGWTQQKLGSGHRASSLSPLCMIYVLNLFYQIGIKKPCISMYYRFLIRFKTWGISNIHGLFSVYMYLLYIPNAD